MELQREKMKPKSLLWWIGGAAAGALLMYFLDPRSGRRRRAMARDKVRVTRKTAAHQFQKATRDVRNRVLGAKARLAHVLKRQPQVDDITLIQRVRSTFGRKVRHSSSIQVTVEQGTITLSGPILASEITGLLRTVSHVPGVRRVINRLDVHRSAENIPGLQGEGAGYLS